MPARPAARAALALAAAAVLAAAAAHAQGGRARPAFARRDSVKQRLLNEELQRADSVVRAEGGPRADHAQLYLSWNAPWGMPRASAIRMPRCGDAAAADTLYLSFLPGRTGPGFNGFSAELLIHAAAGDTLGTWWHFEHGAENAGNLTVQWGPDPSFPGRQPWAATGQGFVKLDRTPAGGRLLMVFAVPYEHAVRVAPDSVYTLCRIVLRHARALAGCERPVCLEWAWATLAFGLKDEPRVARGERFAAWSASAAVCAPEQGPHVEPWRPRAH